MGEPPGRRGEALAPESSLESNEPRSTRTGHEFRLDRDRAPERRNRGMTSASRGGAPRVGPVCLLLLAILGACTNDSDRAGPTTSSFASSASASRSAAPRPRQPLARNERSDLDRSERGGGAIDDEDEDDLLSIRTRIVLASARSNAACSDALRDPLGAEGIELPFGLFDSGKERIEVTDLKLFANAERRPRLHRREWERRGPPLRGSHGRSRRRRMHPVSRTLRRSTRGARSAA